MGEVLDPGGERKLIRVGQPSPGRHKLTMTSRRSTVDPLDVIHVGTLRPATVSDDSE